VIYYFMLELGISPFIKSYRGKNLVSSCVTEGFKDFLLELLSHKYVVQSNFEAKLLKKSAQSKDETGNNIMHQLYTRPQKERMALLEELTKEEN